MGVEMTTKRVAFGGTLTKTEQEILDLLLNEHLTVKQVSIRRKTSRQAVSKIVKNLKEKGHLKAGYQRVDKTQPTLTTQKMIRLHGQEFNIKIIYKDHRYKKLLEESNILMVEGTTVRLYKESIEIYSGESFYSESIQKSTSVSFNYWTRFIVKLEHRLKVILIKPFKQNIRLVNSHYAEIENEIAKDYEYRGDKLRCYTTDDGKLWFLIDNSFNLHEMEFVHPKTSKQDGEKLLPYINDMRDNECIPLSQISRYMADTTKQINEISHGLKSIVDFLKLSIPNGENGIIYKRYIR